MREGLAVIVAAALCVAACDKKTEEADKAKGGSGGTVSAGEVSEYLESSKNSEGKASLGAIAKAMERAFEMERMEGTVLAQGTQTVVLRRLCAGSSKPVPESLSSVDGKKYQSAPSEWMADQAKDAGFACLKFMIDVPQYFQYEVRSDPEKGEFTAYARRLNPKEKIELSISGKVQNGVLNVSPSIVENRTPR